MKTKIGLTNTQLKIIAMVTMLIDHVGMELLPQFKILRIIGRLAFPIFAYMIAEGFAHTHNKGRYFLQVFVLAAVCQLGLYVSTGSVFQSVLVSFCLAVLILFSMEFFRSRRTLPSIALPVVTVLAVVFLVRILPDLLPDTDFAVDYGLLGILIPVAVYYAPGKWKVAAAALLLTGISLVKGGNQWFSLLAIPLLMLYSGKRGSNKLKYLFYIFYPAHLAIIYGIGLLIQ